MIIKRLVLKNIRSYEDQEVEFKPGSTILSGDIGCGKTSILLAIEFALFGLQPGQKGASLLRNGKDEGHVVLEFEVDDKNIVIERGLKKGKSISQSNASLMVNGEKKNLSITELKNFVLSVLNYPPEFIKKTNLLYKFTVYTPQEGMKQIILENPEVRLDTLRHIFGIDKYKKIKENIDIAASKFREQIREFKGRIIDLEEKRNNIEERKSGIIVLENRLKENKSVLVQKKETREKIEKERKEVEEKIKEKEKYEREIDKTNVMLLGKKEQTKSVLREKINLQEQINEAKKTSFDEQILSQLKEKKTKLEQDKKEQDKKYIELLGEMNSMKLKITEAEKMQSQVSSLKMCPTCFQNVPQSYKQNILRKFEQQAEMSNKKSLEFEKLKLKLLEEISSSEKDVSEVNKKIDDLKLVKVRLEALEEKQKRFDEADKQLIVLNKDIEMLDKHVETLKISAFEFKKYDSLFQSKTQELQTALSEEKKSEIIIATTDKEIEMTKRLVETINKDIEEKEKIKQDLINLSEFEDWLSKDFSSMVDFTERAVMLKLREEFSKLFNEWFNVLVPDTFTTRLDEDFTPIIEQQDYALDYAFLSGGERTAIALAYRLALNQVINSLLSRIKTRQLIILDEPTDGFSEQQLDKMRDVLNQLNVKQLLIVSHEQKIESFVENIIKLRKENGLTKIDYQT